jgi:hypothetical protein
MPDTTWKAAEREVAKYFPDGERRGADFRLKNSNTGKTDVISPGWAIEVKHSRRPTYGLVLQALDQATKAQGHPDDIVVAVVHRHGTRYSDSVVYMYTDRFVEHFGPPEGAGWLVRTIVTPRVLYKGIERVLGVSHKADTIPVLIINRVVTAMRLSEFSALFINQE